MLAASYGRKEKSYWRMITVIVVLMNFTYLIGSVSAIYVI